MWTDLTIDQLFDLEQAKQHENRYLDWLQKEETAPRTRRGYGKTLTDGERIIFNKTIRNNMNEGDSS